MSYEIEDTVVDTGQNSGESPLCSDAGRAEKRHQLYVLLEQRVAEFLRGSPEKAQAVAVVEEELHQEITEVLRTGMRFADVQKIERSLNGKFDGKVARADKDLKKPARYADTPKGTAMSAASSSGIHFKDDKKRR